MTEGSPMLPDETLASRYQELRTLCDQYVRAFNRLEAAVTHHRKGKLYGVSGLGKLDEALWAEMDRVLSSLATTTEGKAA
jgi:hypothetical protein